MIYKTYYSAILILILFITSCASIKIPDNASAEDFFFTSISNNTNSEWLIFLPGSSGLNIFDDSLFYFDQAKKLNELNYNVILVDYKKAYMASNRKAKETTGEKINWVLQEAINWTRKKYSLDNEKFKIVGWSLAGEGLCLLANDKSKLNELGVSAIAMYYPANLQGIKVKSEIPILIQVGNLDKITPAREIKKTYSGNVNSEIIELSDGYHGFDIPSLEEAKILRFPPIVGKKHMMQYEAIASDKAFNNLKYFLKIN